jgi:hypothetical protein
MRAGWNLRIGRIIMIPESKYLPDTCRTKLTFGPETACEAKGLVLG